MVLTTVLTGAPNAVGVEGCGGGERGLEGCGAGVGVKGVWSGCGCGCGCGGQGGGGFGFEGVGVGMGVETERKRKEVGRGHVRIATPHMLIKRNTHMC